MQVAHPQPATTSYPMCSEADDGSRSRPCTKPAAPWTQDISERRLRDTKAATVSLARASVRRR